MQKTIKTVCRRPTKRRITQFSLVVGRRNAESSKNRVSSTDDGRKTANSAFHPRMKSEKCKKERFRHGGKSKLPNFRISARAENQNHPISALPPRRKDKKREKLRFRLGGKIENSKNCISARAETQNTAIPSLFPSSPRQTVRPGESSPGLILWICSSNNVIPRGA